MNHVKSAMFPSRAERKKTEIENVLFIDPGLGGTGWAFFGLVVTDRGNHTQRGRPVTGYTESGVVRPKGRQWEGKVADVCAWFRGQLSARAANVVVFEMPEVWLGSATSAAAAGKGDLLKLAFLVGAMAETANVAGCRLPVLISPRDWKGQLPKDAVIRRIRRVIPDATTRDHEADAVGMGLAAQGLL